MGTPENLKKKGKPSPGTKKGTAAKKKTDGFLPEKEGTAVLSETAGPSFPETSKESKKAKGKKKFAFPYSVFFLLLGIFGAVGLYVLSKDNLFYSCLVFLSGLFLGMASSFYEGEKKEDLSDLSALVSSLVPSLLAEKSVSEALEEALSGLNSSRLKDFFQDVLRNKKDPKGGEADPSYLSSLDGEKKKAALILLEALNGKDEKEGREEVLALAWKLDASPSDKDEKFLSAAVTACNLFLLLYFFLEAGGFSL